MLKNGQTCLQDFAHFSTLCMKGLSELCKLLKFDFILSIPKGSSPNFASIIKQI